MRQPQEAARLSGLRGLRNLWSFGSGTRCLVTGSEFVLGTHSQVGAGVLSVPASTWNETGSSVVLSWVPSGGFTVIIGYKQTSGVDGMSLMAGNWNGVYFVDGAAAQTASADFSGAVNYPPAAAHEPPVDYVAVSCAANALQASINGSHVVADTACNMPTFGVAPTLRIGTDMDGYNRADVLVQYLALLDRTSSPEELRAYSADPWGALFAPRRIRIPVASAGGSLPTLSAATYMPGSLTSSGFRPRVTAS